MKTKIGLDRNTAAFTLIEVLVVLAIIAALAAIVLPQLFNSTRKGDEVKTRTILSSLENSIVMYKSAFGDNPPSRLSRLVFAKLEAPNDKNEGSETLVLALSTQRKNGPFINWQDDWLSNSDKDELPKPLEKSNIQKNDLFEVVDFWGNPFVYIHCSDYGKKLHYIDSEGKSFTATARKSKKLGTYCNPDSYQLWSIGANAKNEDGGGDDIANFTISDDDEDQGPP